MLFEPCRLQIAARVFLIFYDQKGRNRNNNHQIGGSSFSTQIPFHKWMKSTAKKLNEGICY